MGIIINGKIKSPMGKLKISPSLSSYTENISSMFFNNISLLIDFDGSHNGTNFIDYSNYNHTISTVGSPTTSTTELLFGSSTGFFNGTDALTIEDHESFNLGTENFTLELWLYPTSTVGTTARIFSKEINSSTPYASFALIRLNTAWQFYATETDGSWTIVNALSVGSVVVDTWQNLTITREGSTFRAFKDGVQTGSTTNAGSLINHDQPVYIGGSSQESGSRYFVGYMDELRLTKGVCRYTEDFTVQSQSFPKI